MSSAVRPEHTPIVSVLMPTYRQEAFLTRAIGSLLAQTFEEFELIVVNDGSGPGTDEIVSSFDDPRLRYIVLGENGGLGAALNLATANAAGEFIAYLPSDDLYDRDHLTSAVRTLRNRQDAYLTYASVRWCRRVWDMALRPYEASPTLRADIPPGAEMRALKDDSPAGLTRMDVRSGNFLAPVQVVHRRGLEGVVRWRERSEIVSDSLEMDYWRALLRADATFVHTGSTTCEWGDHPEQRHKIISGRGTRNANQLSHGYGLSYYRQHYRVRAGQPLNWQPVTEGSPVDERQRYGPLLARHPVESAGGLRILLVGSLSFNPERVLAFAEQGHRLAAHWLPQPHFWETAGPLPFVEVDQIPHDDTWVDRIHAFRPDVIYGLLNWQAIPAIHRVWKASLGYPFVLHFKESPMAAMQVGSWSMLRDLVLGSDGRIFINEEMREWFELTLARAFRDATTMVLDGDFPKRDWMTQDWASPLSDDDGEAHTVCSGRIFLEPMAQLAERKIHVHHYGSRYARWGSHWINAAADSPYLHLHSDVEPQRWTAELSRYDAAWLHVFTSENGGDLRRASWDDLNLPARIGTYAAAGLPWIFRRNAGHRVAVSRLAHSIGAAIAYDDVDELADLLARERRSRQARTRMRDERAAFCFDNHVPTLTGFFASLKPGGGQ